MNSNKMHGTPFVAVECNMFHMQIKATTRDNFHASQELAAS